MKIFKKIASVIGGIFVSLFVICFVGFIIVFEIPQNIYKELTHQYYLLYKYEKHP